MAMEPDKKKKLRTMTKRRKTTQVVNSEETKLLARNITDTKGGNLNRAEYPTGLGDGGANTTLPGPHGVRVATQTKRKEKEQVFPKVASNANLKGFPGTFFGVWTKGS